jgi:hypothetical protein
MHTNRVPPGLRERLGDEAAAGLVQLFNERETKWTADVIGIVTDRFERRLTEETSALRVDMAREFAALRQEMAQGFAAVRQDMAHGQVELLKWAFLFWVGQLFAVASVMALVLRFVRPAMP